MADDRKTTKYSGRGGAYNKRGRPKGSPNKGNVYVKDLISSRLVDDHELVDLMLERAREGNDAMLRLALEYMYGKPRDGVDLQADLQMIITRRVMDGEGFLKEPTPDGDQS